MRKFGLLAVAVLFLVAQAASGATWSIIGFSVQPQNAADVAAAADLLMASEVGQEFPGRLFLQANVADGANPATHSFVPVYQTAGESEAFRAKLQGDPAWAKFQQTMTDKTEPVSNVMYRTVQRWGEISDDDVVWRLHSFAIRDVPGFVTALQTFMESETGKGFPGQVFLSAVVAGGISPVTHAISVGQESEAAIEEWEKTLSGNADWQRYLEASRAAGDYLGNNLVRTMKTWGATLDEVTTP